MSVLKPNQDCPSQQQAPNPATSPEPRGIKQSWQTLQSTCLQGAAVGVRTFNACSLKHVCHNSMAE